MCVRGKGQEVDVTKQQVSAQCEDELAATKGCYLKKGESSVPKSIAARARRPATGL